MSKINVYETIEKRCRDLKISVSELCRQTNVDRKSMQPWKEKNPKSIERMLVLEGKLTELENQKQNENV